MNRVIMDLRPFEIVKDDVFKYMSKTILSVFNKNILNYDIDNATHPTTICRNIHGLFESEKNEILKNLKQRYVLVVVQ